LSITQENFQFIADLVRARSAIALAPGKEYLVESRLSKFARDEGVTVDQYVTRRRTAMSHSDTELIVEALTTNETSWFRDSQPFTALSGHILPALTQTRGTLGSLRIWSAACSTGQEPYSIAMTLKQYFAQSAYQPQAEILATDLSQQVIDQAMTGRYSQLEVNRGLPAANLVQYFDRRGTEWEISAELRAMVRFRRHNLLDPAPVGGPFDVVFLRNVLIYFDVPTKLKVLRTVHGALRPGGFLVLGAAETTVGLDDSWDRVTVGRSSIYQKAAITA